MNNDQFFAAIKSVLFTNGLTQSQVDGINSILSAFATHGDGRRATLAYALATAYHETGRRMVPVREGFARSDAGARHAVNSLAADRGPQSAVAKYARPQPPHGHVYYGRGHVQLTWIDNYQASSADAGADLVANPDAMLDPETSARVLIRGLMDGRWNGRGKGVQHYEMLDGKPGMTPSEAAQARRTVNVQDKAELIAGYAAKFDAALDGAGMPLLPRSAPSPTGGILAAFLALSRRILGDS
jgi:hypothetical protein